MQAAISLGEIGDKSAVPALHKMARDFPNERLWAGFGLAGLGDQEGFEIVSDTAVYDERWTERRHAVEALGKLGDRRVVPALKKALKDEDRKVRIGAARALGKIGDEAALRALDDAAGTNPASEEPDAEGDNAFADEALEYEYLRRLAAQQHGIAKFKASSLNYKSEPLTTGKLAEWAAEKGLPPLEVVVAVSATRADMRDDDLAALAGFESVTHVDLSRTKITDAGLIHLKGLKNLKFLDVYDTKVTNAGVAALQKALPDLKINRDPSPQKN
jgi:hypothetical protein